MADNPRSGENSSKGSRYIPERLVGPGVIEQNSYFDRAKARLHIGNITPVPNHIGVPGELTAASHDFSSIVSPSNPIGPGDLMRVLSTSTALTFTFRSGSELLPGTALVHVRADSEVLVVIPAGATGYTLSQDAFAIEFTKDN